MSSSVRDYCLQTMGITQWQVRESESHSIQKPYMLWIDEEINHQKNELIGRMLQALKWPQALTHIEVCNKQTDSTFFFERVKTFQVKKALIFGEPFSIQCNSSQIAIAIVPTLTELMANPTAKKKAWAIMQALV